jgi:hypothetical protein
MSELITGADYFTLSHVAVRSQVSATYFSGILASPAGEAGHMFHTTYDMTGKL